MQTNNLNYSNGTISGALDEGLNSLSLTDFVGFHQQCLTTGTGETEPASEIRFFHDTANHGLRFYSKNVRLENANYMIYNLAGQLVLNGNLNENSTGSTEIDVGKLEAGQYLVSLNVEGVKYGFRFYCDE